MHVNITLVDQDTGAETAQGDCYLTDLELDTDEGAAALVELTRIGRVYVGGGAAPLFRLTRYNGSRFAK